MSQDRPPRTSLFDALNAQLFTDRTLPSLKARPKSKYELENPPPQTSDDQLGFDVIEAEQTLDRATLSDRGAIEKQDRSRPESSSGDIEPSIRTTGEERRDRPIPKTGRNRTRQQLPQTLDLEDLSPQQKTNLSEQTPLRSASDASEPIQPKIEQSPKSALERDLEDRVSPSKDVTTKQVITLEEQIKTSVGSSTQKDTENKATPAAEISAPRRSRTDTAIALNRSTKPAANSKSTHVSIKLGSIVVTPAQPSAPQTAEAPVSQVSPPSPDTSLLSYLEWDT